MSIKYLYHDEIGYVSLLSHMGTDKDVAEAARVSLISDNQDNQILEEGDTRLIRYLARHKHTTPFEHCTMRFKFKVPIFVAKHHMRHRTWSYNEVSRRYTSEGIEFYLPEKFRKQAKKNLQASIEGEDIDPEMSTLFGEYMLYPQYASEAVRLHSQESLGLYNSLLDQGICREQARMVLPQNLYTEYWATSNLLNIIKFLKLRLAPDAQVEIRLAAEAVAEFVLENFPESYKAWFHSD